MLNLYKYHTKTIYSFHSVLPLAAGILIIFQLVSCNRDKVDQKPGGEYLNELTEASIDELQSKLDSGQISSFELVDFYLARIEAYDKDGPRLNSIAHINPNAQDNAQALDLEREQNGSRAPLHACAPPGLN